jgi:potassium efflux system protein
MEAILREAALGHPRVLRVPAPIVRFIKVGQTGLDFGLFVFVAQLEDRLVVTNDLNQVILRRLIEEKILDPAPAPEFRLRDINKLADALRAVAPETSHATPPPPR